MPLSAPMTIRYFSMLHNIYHFKIRYIIVMSISVFVVNMFSFIKFTAKLLFYYVPVLKYSFSIYSDSFVSLFGKFQGTLRNGIAGCRTKPLHIFSAWRNIESLITGGTIFKKLLIVVRCKADNFFQSLGFTNTFSVMPQAIFTTTARNFSSIGLHRIFFLADAANKEHVCL